jgi:hypothetical protein
MTNLPTISDLIVFAVAAVAVMAALLINGFWFHVGQTVVIEQPSHYLSKPQLEKALKIKEIELQ